jgi:tetratricopeptide (TPR) repeat protein
MASLEKWFIYGKDPILDEGLRAYQSGAYADGAVALERYIESPNPDPVLKRTAIIYLSDCFAQMGEEALNTGEIDDAIAIFTTAVSWKPDFADLRFKLAKAFVAKDEAELAIEELEKALDINPKFVAANLLKAIAQYKSEECASAMGTLIDVLMRYPHLENDLYQEFCVCHNAGQNEEALEKLEAMLAEQANLGQEMIRHAAELAGSDKPQEAADLYSRLTQQFPTYADIRYGYAKVLFKLGQKESALSELEAALLINPKYADALSFKGVILRSLGQEESAKASFRAALEVNPEHPVALMEIGRLR